MEEETRKTYWDNLVAGRITESNDALIERESCEGGMGWKGRNRLSGFLWRVFLICNDTVEKYVNAFQKIFFISRSN